MDELILTYLAALAGCVCEKVNAVNETCFCGITLGDQYVSTSGIGDCEEACGEAWVRITGAYPSTVVGQPNFNLDNCGASMGVDIEIGVLRCLEVPEGGEAPTPEQFLEAANVQIKDMIAIRDAVLCCEHFPSYILGAWTPIGPDGGLVGGSWTISVGVV